MRFPFRVAVSGAIILAMVAGAALEGHTAARPRFGGTLRIQMQARVESLHPRELPANPTDSARAAVLRMAGLLYETLVTLNEAGEPRPALAVNWSHDRQFRRWEFRVRAQVRFHDGTLLTPANASLALQWATRDSDLQISNTKDTVVISSETPQRDLLRRLAAPRFCIYRMASGARAPLFSGEWQGTGPFVLTQFEARRRAVFVANGEHWGGRPFVESVEVEMGVPPRQQVIAFELGRADVVELGPLEARRALAAERRVWSSLPSELLAVVFSSRDDSERGLRIREALSLSIERSSLHAVLLQRQGEPSGALLPQWLSGYAFLFPSARDVERARQLWLQVSPSSRAVVLDYDTEDPLAQSFAERIAVNAREAGIPLQVTGSARGVRSKVADARLVRIRVTSSRAGEALSAMAEGLALPQSVGVVSVEELEGVYKLEKQMLSDFQIIPLAHLPQTFGLSARVRNWMPTPTGQWQLADVWLATPVESAGKPADGRRP
jgi:MarR-like DNA-binding transcriptional regulator SgrR of sgrS sRNA